MGVRGEEGLPALSSSTQTCQHFPSAWEQLGERLSPIGKESSQLPVSPCARKHGQPLRGSPWAQFWL